MEQRPNHRICFRRILEEMQQVQLPVRIIARLVRIIGNAMMTNFAGGNINMAGNEIKYRTYVHTDAWIEQDGTIKTEALLKTVITGQNIKS
jgi:hypothetical protein